MFGWLKKKERDPKEALRESLGSYQLPSFPRVALEALRMLRDPDVPPDRIADRLAEDPALSARILGVASSSAFALRHPVRHVGHAIVLLGRSAVESLVLAAVVQKTLSTGPAPRGMDMRAFWRAASRRAATSRALADVLHPTTRAETFTASLLSDMAVPLLAKAHGDRYAHVFQTWRREGGELAALEREALSIDHASVAGWAAQTWSFPEVIADAIGSHHDEQAGASGGILPSVALAADVGDEQDDTMERVIEDIRVRWNVSPDVVIDAIREGLARGDEMAGRLA